MFCSQTFAPCIGSAPAAVLPLLFTPSPSPAAAGHQKQHLRPGTGGSMTRAPGPRKVASSARGGRQPVGCLELVAAGNVGNTPVIAAAWETQWQQVRPLGSALEPPSACRGRAVRRQLHPGTAAERPRRADPFVLKCVSSSRGKQWQGREPRGKAPGAHPALHSLIRAYFFKVPF